MDKSQAEIKRFVYLRLRLEEATFNGNRSVRSLQLRVSRAMFSGVCVPCSHVLSPPPPPPPLFAPPTLPLPLPLPLTEPTLPLFPPPFAYDSCGCDELIVTRTELVPLYTQSVIRRFKLWQ